MIILDAGPTPAMSTNIKPPTVLGGFKMLYLYTLLVFTEEIINKLFGRGYLFGQVVNVTLTSDSSHQLVEPSYPQICLLVGGKRTNWYDVCSSDCNYRNNLSLSHKTSLYEFYMSY